DKNPRVAGNFFPGVSPHKIKKLVKHHPIETDEVRWLNTMAERLENHGQEKISQAPQTAADYGAEHIKVLEGLEAVRKRPAMYIGSTGLDRPHHPVYEAGAHPHCGALHGF